MLSRRTLLKALGAGAAATAVAGGVGGLRSARAAGSKPTFLIVIPAFGGGAIIDSFLPIRQSESANATTIDCFPDAEVVDIPGSPIRAADAVVPSLLGQPATPYTVPLSGFAAKHHDEMMVTTMTATSVNHAIAQRRALSGGGAWSGRTLQECVALQYGEDYPLPNVNMATLGYLEPGADPSMPSYAYGEPIPDPLLKPLSLSADKGIKGTPNAELIRLARAKRDEVLDPQSGFYQAFRLSQRLELWKKQRAAMQDIEDRDLISKLFFVEEQPGVPLSEFGLGSAEEAAQLNAVFPNILGGEADPLEQQAALAFLLLKNRVSVTVTLAPTFTPVIGGPFVLKNTPLAFDGSHNDHRSSQALMWLRVLSIADRLIDLLKATPFDEEESFWDRTMIHFATDFGRDKKRADSASIWGTGHHLNNGHLTVSPLVRGNTVLGGVNPDTGETYGFDLNSGAPDEGRETSEGESFAGLLQALGVDTSGANLVDVPAMRKG